MMFLEFQCPIGNDFQYKFNRMRLKLSEVLHVQVSIEVTVRIVL